MTKAFPTALPMCFDPETKLFNLRYVTQSLNGFNVQVRGEHKDAGILKPGSNLGFLFGFVGQLSNECSQAKFDICQLISHALRKRSED